MVHNKTDLTSVIKSANPDSVVIGIFISSKSSSLLNILFFTYYNKPSNTILPWLYPTLSLVYAIIIILTLKLSMQRYCNRQKQLQNTSSPTEIEVPPGYRKMK